MQPLPLFKQSKLKLLQSVSVNKIGFCKQSKSAQAAGVVATGLARHKDELSESSVHPQNVGFPFYYAHVVDASTQP
jgi:hypothetical protein